MGALSYIDHGQRACNYLVIILLAGAVFISGSLELRLATASPLLWYFIGLGFALAIWAASYVTPQRLLALILTIYVMEYAKETIGVKAGLWSYTGSGEYQFGVWLWALVGVAAFSVSVGLAAPFIRAFKLNIPRGALIILPMVFLAAALRGSVYAKGSWAAEYTGFYLFLAAVGILGALGAEARVPIAVMATALALGLPPEYAGSTPPHAIWLFCGDISSPPECCLPPLYLLAGCWPLEIWAQFVISAWLAGEELGKYTEEETEEGTMGAVLTGAERRFRWFMALSAFTYFVVGFIFLLAPEMTFTLAAKLKTALFPWDGWEPLDPQIGKFWLALAFSMMMTITALAIIVAMEPRGNKHYAIPLMISKASSALAGLGLFWLSRHCFEYLLITAVDGALFILTLIFFLLAYNAGVKEDWRLFHNEAPTSGRRHGPAGSGAGGGATGNGDNGGADNPHANEASGLQPGRAVPEKLEDGAWRPGEGGLGGPSPSLVVVETCGDKFEMLEAALEKAKFWEVLDCHYRKYLKDEKQKEPRSQENFRVVIKPNFMFLHNRRDTSTYTDPELVEHLIILIHGRGFKNITAVEAQSTYGNYFANRGVVNVAEYAGYKNNPKMADKYQIVDLTETSQDYDYGGRLGMHKAGPAWRDAHFRVSFAKNKTHVFCNYTLTLKNIYGTLPEQNKLLEYHTKREYDWPTIESLKHFPVHFGIIDAVISADGQFGVMTDPTPRKTDTIIAGENLMAVDWVGARKMGLDPDDPNIGRFLPLAVQTWRMPTFAWQGSREVYDPWENVSDVFIKSLDMLEEKYAFSDFFFSGFATLDEKAFPYKVSAWPNRILRWLLGPLKRRYFK